MQRILTIVLFFSAFIGAWSQEYPFCPSLSPFGEAYENPLYDKWLSAYDVKYYMLTLEVTNTSTFIEGTAELVVEATRELDTLVLELQDGLVISRIFYTDQTGSMNYLPESELQFAHENDAVYIELDRTRYPGELFRIKIEYGGEAGRDRGFFAGISSKRATDYGFDVTYTLSEPLHARDWFPVKQVLEDKIDSLTFNLVCDKGLLAGSNGLLVNVEEEGGNHILTWKTQYPMAYYLLSFAVADYMDYSFYAQLPGEGDSVLVQNYIYNTEDVLTDWKEEIDETGSMIALFSGLLIDYPFANEKYGHSMAPMGGGMEHQTMTTIQNFKFSLVAHELAHQWFGDHITCASWQDIWINEGFASYMEYVAAEHLRGLEAAGDWMESAMSLALGEREGSVYVPEEDVEDVHRLFSYPLTYKKGAILLHMIRFILNEDEVFFAVLKTYLNRFQSGLATGADFQSIMEEVSEIDFSCFFRQWYYGEGYPVFKLFWEQQGDSLLIRSEQTGTSPEVTPLFQMPFELEIVQSGGQSQRIRLMQQTNEDAFSVKVEGLVERLVFDPGNHLLKTATVSRIFPGDKPFLYGPNPVSSELFIQFPGISQIDAVRITNMAGQVVFTAADTENPVTLNLTTLADGPYLLELSGNSETYRERIVKSSVK